MGDAEDIKTWRQFWGEFQSLSITEDFTCAFWKNSFKTQ